MVAQTAVKMAGQQKRMRAEKSGSDTESIRKYAQAVEGGGGVSFVVSGSRARGYVPSQAGLMGLNQNRVAWQSIYQRCASGTKRKNNGAGKSDKIKALRIAQRIADGKRVPPEDEEFLMRYSITLWVEARRLALMKEISEEEEETEQREEKKEDQEEKQEAGQETSKSDSEV